MRAPGEVLLARAHAARGDLEASAEAIARLRVVARDAASGALGADLRACEGTLAAASGDQ